MHRRRVVRRSPAADDRRGARRWPPAYPLLAGCLVAFSAALATHAGKADERTAAPPADQPVDFAHDIAPLLLKRCAKCHVGTQKKGGFSINTRQSLLAGGDGGRTVVSGQSARSELIERLESDDQNFRMPPEGERLTPEQIARVRRWIDAGLSWEEGFVFGRTFRQAPLAPRRPAPPEASGVDHPIDRFLQAAFARRGDDAGAIVSDRVFARRASLDLAGLVPDPRELAALEADRRTDKRARYVGQLLANKDGYAAHWLTFWNDLLRNAYHGTGFIDGGRRQITGWLYAALRENMPYDQFVRGLVHPAAGSGADGFIYGIKWRGTVNESQRREIQAAQSVTQVFLGTNLKCASCHDSFVNHWKLTDAYALSAVFADGPLELHRCDQPIGIPAEVGFLYPELGSIDGSAPRDERLAQLAGRLTSPQNGRLARTIVNRLWARLFGRGLVEPVDNLDAEPWHQDLLDFLASDLADHGYDLQRTLRLMATSRAYQMPADPRDKDDSAEEDFSFRGPRVKRLSAEQFVDAVFTLTGDWPAVDPAWMKLDGRGQGGQLGAVAHSAFSTIPPPVQRKTPPLTAALWIWSDGAARQATAPQTIFLRRVWPLAEQPARAVATFTADNSFELFVNGQPVAQSDNWGAPAQADVTAALAAGDNVIAIRATNSGDSPNPAGLIGEIVCLDANGNDSTVLTTDDSWQVAGNAPAEWLKPDYDAAAWGRAQVLGNAAAGPWDVARIVKDGGVVVQTVAQLPADFRIRAALLPLDPLQAALGRPNREHVVSSRDSTPTMLQALELTNGALLNERLKRGALAWHSRGGETPRRIESLYATAFSRAPRAEEARVALEVLGSPPTAEGWEDLLWTICLSPEFQLTP